MLMIIQTTRLNKTGCLTFIEEQLNVKVMRTILHCSRRLGEEI